MALLKRMALLIVPVLTVCLFALIITLPWGFGPELVYLPPLLTAALIFAWTVRYPGSVPGVMVFVVGIAMDIVTAGPIGFWAFLFLLGYAFGLHMARIDAVWTVLVILFGWLPVSVVIGAAAWGLTSIYFGQTADWVPVFESVKVSWFVVPALAFVIRWFSGRMVSDGPTAKVAQ